jgi:hypothetical protein
VKEIVPKVRLNGAPLVCCGFLYQNGGIRTPLQLDVGSSSFVATFQDEPKLSKQGHLIRFAGFGKKLKI